MYIFEIFCQVRRCCTCKQIKKLDDFYKEERVTLYKRQSQCKECRKAQNNTDYKRDMSIPEIAEKKNLKNKLDSARLRKEKPDTVEKYDTKYRNTSKGIATLRSVTQARNAAKRRATPKWSNKKKIQEVYKLAVDLGDGWEIDHIIPLKADIVCYEYPFTDESTGKPVVSGPIVQGLHVHENLQILPERWNKIKSNKFDGTCDNQSWYDDVPVYGSLERE